MKKFDDSDSKNNSNMEPNQENSKVEEEKSLNNDLKQHDMSSEMMFHNSEDSIKAGKRWPKFKFEEDTPFKLPRIASRFLSKECRDE
jgi:hypothetical protein